MTENTVLDNNVSSIIKFKDKDGNEYPEWEYAPIGTVCEINPKPDKLENEFYYIDLESVEDGKLLDEKIVFKSNAPSRAQRTLKENDILFQMVRPYQKNNYFFREVRDKQSVASTGYAQIRSNNINPMFVYEFIFANKFVNDVLLRCTGSNYPAINSSDLKGINISIPCKEEQSKIALFLSSIDNLISIQESSISILETYNKGLISKIFKQEIRFKDDNGNEFPDWEKVKLFDLVEHYGGTALEPLVIENGSCKFISIGNYSPNGKYIDNGQRINPVGKAKDKQLKKDDLVMVLNDKTKNGTIIGSTILVDDDNYIYNQRSERLICKKNVLPYFLWSYINSPLIKNKILQLVQGGTQIYVNFSSVYNMDMHLPIMEEQNKIANFLKQLDKILEQEKVYLEQLKTIKKGLLQQMFV